MDPQSKWDLFQLLERFVSAIERIASELKKKNNA